MSAVLGVRRGGSRPEPVVDFVHDLALGEVPDDVVGRATVAVRDALGAALAGRCAPAARVVEQVGGATFPGDAATVVGSGTRLSAPGAALVNGVLANALDMDDSHRRCQGHPGPASVAAVLAVAEATGSSGRAFLEAMIVAYEVGVRAATALHRLYSPHYHCSGAWSPIGAAAGAARLLGLTRSRTGAALGLAEFHGAIGPEVRSVEHPSMAKDGSGWGALAAVTAALLADAGMTAPPSLLSASVASDEDLRLGEVWYLRELGFKPHPGCRWAHPAVDLALELRLRHHLVPSRIDSIVVRTFEHAARLRWRRPSDTDEAQFSIPFLVAVALRRGTIRPADVVGPALADPEVLALADRVHLVAEPQLDRQYPARRPAHVTIRTSDGTCVEGFRDVPRGDADCPLSDAELTDKFLEAAEPVLTRPGAEHAVDLFARLAGLEEIGELVAGLQR